MPRIVCPSCGARYDVAAAMIGPTGKNVRCARCGTVWLARLEPGETEPPPQWPEPPPPRVRAADEAPPANPLPGAPSRPSPPVAHAAAPPASAAPRRRGSGAAIGWAITLLLLAGGGYGAVNYPAAVIEAWPASARLYAMLGLAP